MITITDIKSVVISSKSCTFTTGCTLESKFGKVILDLSKLGRTINIILHLKRLSGNGKVIIDGIETVIASKFDQEVEVTNSIIEISSCAAGVGQVNIFAIDYEQEDEGLTLNWKKIISRCGQYHCLRMAGNRLFASEGAYISNGSLISKIETNPSGTTKLENGKLVFVQSCEILELVVNPLAPLIPLVETYIPRQPPTPLLIPIPNSPTVPTVNPAIYKKQMKNEKDFVSIQQFIYDSLSTREFSGISKKSTKTAKLIKSNNIDYLVLKQGSYDIQLPILEKSSNYAAVITVKKLNGNGKLYATLNDKNLQDLTVDGMLREHAFLLRTNDLEDDSVPCLKLFTGDNGFGEVLISRVRVLKMDGNVLPLPNLEIDVLASPAKQVNLLPENKSFVIVIPSYNNVRWAQKNIESVLNQNYGSYRVIFTDDRSSDGTFELVERIVRNSPKKDQFTLIRNPERKGALANLYNMIQSCRDEEIILTLDGDDWLAHENVLSRLNEIYYSGEVWMTYGQYQNYPDSQIGISQPIPQSVVNSNSFRSHTWCSSHLRTFYVWLFKQMKREDFLYQGEFFTMTWDFCIMLPMLEMASTHSKFLSDILYIYNLENPINDHKVNRDLQQKLDRHIRGMPKYNRLAGPVMQRTEVGLLIIATNQYDRFIQGLISSADNYFLPDSDVKVTYYIFSDKNNNILSKRKIVQNHIDHHPFPLASMERFKHFTNHSELLSKEDYLYYVDVDCLFVDYIFKRNILGDLVGVRHCGYTNSKGPFEDDVRSVFYTDHNEYKHYFGGGFSGAKSKNYLELSNWCSQMIDLDLSNGIIPRFHDETAINKYFLDNPPTVILNPDYHFPQGNAAHYKKEWGEEKFYPKILLLDKNHKEIRA